MRLMPTALIGALLLFLLCLPGMSLAGGSLEKHLALAPGGTLTIDSEVSGSILIEGCPETEEALVQLSSDHELGEVLEFSFEEREDGLELRLVPGPKCREGSKEYLFGLIRIWNEPRRPEVELRVRVPQRTALALKASRTRIELSGLEGALNAATSRCSYHGVNLAGALEIHNSRGNIQLEQARGSVKLHNSRGGIEVWGMEGPLEAVNRRGQIVLLDVRGELEVDNSRGHTTIEELQGRITASVERGDLRLVMAGPPSGDCSLSAGRGSIELTVPRQVDAMVQADVSRGRLRLGLPVTTEDVAGDHLSGRLGQGGPLLKLQASRGDISLDGR